MATLYKSKIFASSTMINLDNVEEIIIQDLYKTQILFKMVSGRTIHWFYSTKENRESELKEIENLKLNKNKIIE